MWDSGHGYPLTPASPRAPNTVERLQQEGVEEFLRDNRGPTGLGIQVRQPSRQADQGHVPYIAHFRMSRRGAPSELTPRAGDNRKIPSC